MTKKKYPAAYVVEARYAGDKKWDFVDTCWTRREALALLTQEVSYGSKVRILKYVLEGVIKES